jgi:hypothetical protein
LGRVNRIGTKATKIYNYNFYPSEQGDKRINLRQKSLVKLQSSHSTFGEDNKIYTLDEIIDQFNMFEEKEEDKDIRTEYLEWLRKFREQNPESFNSIRKLPLKVRCIRAVKDHQQSIAFVKNGEHKNIYLHHNSKSTAISFEKAVKIFEAEPIEEGKLPIPDIHYTQINSIINQFEKDITTPDMIGGHNDKLDVRTQSALNSVSNWLAAILETDRAKEAAVDLLPLLQNGTYANLTNEVYKLRNEQNLIKLEKALILLAKKYTSKIKRETKDIVPLEPQIIISETFI